MHTFLVREGVWRAQGASTDPAGNDLAIVGEARISHDDGGWRNASWMELPDGTRLENIYHVVPLTDGRKETSWTALHPALGRQHGHLVLVGDTLLLTSVTEDGAHATAEAIVRLADDRYACRGCLYRGDTLISSWSVELTRAP